MTAGLDQAKFFERTIRALTPLDAKRAQSFLADLRVRAREDELDGVVALLDDDKAASFIAAVLDLSPFIREALQRVPRILDWLARSTPEAALQEILADIAVCGAEEGASEASLMAGLRLKKREAHVLIALCDLAGIFNTEATTGALADLAEACTGAAIRFLLRDADAAGKIRLVDRNDPERDCGWIVLGMGKFGARELNYSSDIDLIIFIDDKKPAIIDPYECVETFSRLTRRLVRILQDRTEDGYVFRVDLRLRPDPGSTPLAIPVGAALHYYEGRGQNWERAAMIKARPVAGDRESGAAVLAELSPYVWRKYLDYAAIADVHSIKRQIHAHKGHGDIAVRGHNVKLGRGGIREIEFFVQTQQLIAGGRFPELRGNQTVAMLAKLAERGWITEQARDALTKEYHFLRDVEHRVLNYRMLVARDANADTRVPSRLLELHLTGNMERYMWSFDGRMFSAVSDVPIRFAWNERVRVKLVNNTMMAHPIHLHGMFFEMVNGQSASLQPRKNTMIVQPGASATFDLTANEPGDWAFHCHLLYHMHGGMMQTVTVMGPGAAK